MDHDNWKENCLELQYNSIRDTWCSFLKAHISFQLIQNYHASSVFHNLVQDNRIQPRPFSRSEILI